MSTSNDLLSLYTRMCEVRTFEERLAALFASGALGGTSHFCIGQEACAVGVVSATAPTDLLVSNHRGHGHLLARGLDPQRVFAELMGRETGYCGGRGGSQHLCCIEKSFLGTNGITGGGLPLGTGAAAALKYREEGRVVIVFFGDGAANQGTFHESLNLASLWSLPVLFVCENNGYAMSMPVSRTTAGGDIAGRAVAYGMQAERGDGMDVTAVRELAARQIDAVRTTNRPQLLELATYRFCGHSKNDPRIYRTDQEENEWQQHDCLSVTANALRHLGIADSQITEARTGAEQRIHEASERALATAAAAPETAPTGVFVEEHTPPPAPVPAADAGRSLYFSAAVREALDEALDEDDSVVLLGEDIGLYGGAFGITKGLWKRYGPKRIWETPISENSVVGATVGAAALGLRPVVELMFMDFIGLTVDQILNSAGKLHYMYNGQLTVPLVIRTPGGAKGGYGPSHSQMLANLFVGVPGLRIVAPSNAADAKSLLKAAIRDPNPVLFIENKRLYPVAAPIAEFANGELGRSVVYGDGDGGGVSVFAYSAMVPMALQVQAALAKRGVSIEVVDLVSLQPLDVDTIIASVTRTGRAVIAEEGCRTGGVGAEVAALIAERCMDSLEAPVARVAAADCPIPSSTDLEPHVLPSLRDLAKTVQTTLRW